VDVVYRYLVLDAAVGASCRAGVAAARDARCADGAGNASHAAVQAFLRFAVIGLGVSAKRVLDPLTTPLERKLEEVDFIEAFAWWLVAQVGVNTETAWSYTCAANAWHERYYHVPFAGGMPLTRIRNTLHGMQVLRGQPVLRRKRIGVRPAHLAAGIRARLRPESSALDANYAAAFETALVALARGGEVVASRGSRSFDPRIHPTRKDVSFTFDAAGQLSGCTIFIVNIKARAAERFRRLPVHLPIRGKHLSPGLALYYLCKVLDPVPASAESMTPLFRDPATNAILTVSSLRTMLRACMSAIGRDASLYGAHSLRIGGATALAWLKAPGEHIQAAGRWHSDAYLRYLRDTKDLALSYLARVASADTDDFEADYVAIDAHGFDDDDEE
jgi:hypothetical protein